MAFAPVQDVLKSIYGDTITLYRGQRNFEQTELSNNRLLFSWTAEESVARAFSLNNRLFKEITDDTIKQAIDQFNRAGFCKFGGYTYKLMTDDPDYYVIYSKSEQITDGMTRNLYRDFKREQADRAEHNAKINKVGYVVKADVPIDKIVWVTNDLNSKEFIVKLNPL